MWSYAATGELGLTVSPNIFEKQIAKRHRGHALLARCRYGVRHRGLVLLVAARKRNADLEQGQACRLGLRAQELGAHRVHGDAIEVLIHRREQAHDVELTLGAQHVQRPGTVFAAAPRKPGLLGHARSIGAMPRAVLPTPRSRRLPAPEGRGTDPAWPRLPTCASWERACPASICLTPF